MACDKGGNWWSTEQRRKHYKMTPTVLASLSLLWQEEYQCPGMSRQFSEQTAGTGLRRRWQHMARHAEGNAACTWGGRATFAEAALPWEHCVWHCWLRLRYGVLPSCRQGRRLMKCCVAVLSCSCRAVPCIPTWCWNAPTKGAGTSWRAWGTGKYAHMQQGWVWELICNSNVVTEVDKFNYLETFKPGFWVQHSCVFVKNDHLLHLLCNDFHILNCHLSS